MDIEIINQVWKNAQTDSKNNPHIWRKDSLGAWIRKDQLNRRSLYGWTVDYIIPLDMGGANVVSNLKAVHWLNSSSCIVKRNNTVFTSEGRSNVRKNNVLENEK